MFNNVKKSLEMTESPDILPLKYRLENTPLTA